MKEKTSGDIVRNVIGKSANSIHSLANKLYKKELADDSERKILETLKDHMKKEGIKELDEYSAEKFIKNNNYDALLVEGKSQWDGPRDKLGHVHTLSIKDAKVVDKNKNPVNYDHALYVLGSDGKLLVHKDELGANHDKLNPNKLSIGKKVLCAGHISITSGKIIVIDNDSGHYMHNGSELQNAINYFAGCDVLGEGFSYDVV